MAQSGPSGIDSVRVKRGQCELNIYAHFEVFPERFSHVLDNPGGRKTSGKRERGKQGEAAHWLTTPTVLSGL